MDRLTISPALLQPAATTPARSADPGKIRDAARQFEALLLNELLQAAHPDGGWLGGGSESGSSTAFGFAEQQLAAALADHGGIGLANLVADGLEKQR